MAQKVTYVSDMDDSEVDSSEVVAITITRYGTLVAWAKELGRQDCASVLQQTLDEEKATDAKLTRIAESRLNRKAAT